MKPYIRRTALVLLVGLFLAGCSTDTASVAAVSAARGTMPGSSQAGSAASATEPSSSSAASATEPGSSSAASAMEPSSSEPSSTEPSSSSTASATEPGSSAASSALVVASADTGSRDATPYVRTPTASGTSLLGNSTVDIDASNTSEGYVMARYNGGNSRVKLQLTPDGGTTYTYDLHGGGYETFPLVAGSNGYTINVFENVSGDQYAQVCGTHFQASLTSSLLPFLYPNQFVNFYADSSTVSLGSQLATGAANDLGVVDAVYNWTISHIVYDFDKAAAAAAGSIPYYLPDVDSIISTGKGICFDYAAVMVAMLRSQRIPTKLVVGYAGQIYHAWISVYITDVGWINDIIQFNGTSWVRMDPTFASSGNGSKDIMQYIGNGNNYQALLVY